MRVLIACEYSGIVRDAFTLRGHDAISCDILPTDRPQGKHYRGNVLDILDQKWDLMIAHPPCTYLANSGSRWLYKGGKGADRDPIRWHAMEEAANFFNLLLSAPIPRIAIENPIMHKHARTRVKSSYAQIIHPWQYGHGETKATCLWLKGLPLLSPTDIVEGRQARIHRLSPTEDRWKIRSTTFKGIARAMADQWG